MKKFNKFYVKRDPATMQVLIKDDEPVLGDVAKKDCPLEQRHVDILNKDWKESGVFYAEVEVDEKEEKTSERIALEAEAKEMGVKFRENISDEKLQEKINEAINK